MRRRSAASVAGTTLTRLAVARHPCVSEFTYSLRAGGCHKQPPAAEMRPSHPRLETVGERGPLRVFLNPDSCMGRNPYRQGRDSRMAQKMDVVGIDVSKATLDAYALTSQQARQFANDPAGHQALVAWLQGLGVDVAVLSLGRLRTGGGAGAGPGWPGGARG